MRNVLRKKLAVTITGLALVVSAGLAGSPASASEPEASSPPSADAPLLGPESSLTADQRVELEALVAATDPATAVFDADEALGAGVSDTAVADFAAAYQARGLGVSNLSPEVQGKTTAAGELIAASASSCTGARGYTGFYGWGWQFALNSCDTDLLIAALAGGGGATAAVGGVISAAGVTAPAGAVTAAVGGLIVAGAGVVGICKAASYDAKAIYLNAFVIGNIGCWGQ